MKAINLFLLATMVGIEIILGIVVAPAIFYPQKFIGEGILNHYQSGLIMTQIFVKMGYSLIIISTIHFLFELYSYIKNDFPFYIKFSKLMLSILILILSLIFVFYFTYTIIDFQNLGEQIINEQKFISIHNASETVIKIILIMQVFLYFLNFKNIKNTQ
ncbi:DUF4149 domain-containing protein [Campylobacter hepaticus]